MAAREGKDRNTKNLSLSAQRVSLPPVLKPSRVGIVKSRNPVTARNPPVAGHAIPPNTQRFPQLPLSRIPPGTAPGGPSPNVSDTAHSPCSIRNTSRILTAAQHAKVLEEALNTLPMFQIPPRAKSARDIERVASYSRSSGSQARSHRAPRVSAVATFAKQAKQEQLHEYILKNEVGIRAKRVAPTSIGTPFPISGTAFRGFSRVLTSRTHGAVGSLSRMSLQRKPNRYCCLYSHPHGVTASDEDDRLAISELLETEVWLAFNTATAIHTVIHLDVQLLDPVTRRAKVDSPLNLDNHLTTAQFWNALNVSFTKQFPGSTLYSTPESFRYAYVPKLKSADDPPKPCFHASYLVSNADSSNRTFQEFIRFCMRKAREKAVEVYAAVKAQAKQTRIGYFKTSRYDAGGRAIAVTHVSISREAAVFANLSIAFNQVLI